MIAKRTMAIWCQQWKWGIPSVYWRSSDFHITFGHIVINKNPAWSPVQYKNNIKTSVWFSFTGIFFYVFQRSLLPEWNAVLYRKIIHIEMWIFTIVRGYVPNSRLSVIFFPFLLGVTEADRLRKRDGKLLSTTSSIVRKGTINCGEKWFRHPLYSFYSEESWI
jgi:hypothetical protein